MKEKIQECIDEFKDYIETNSKYETKVVKGNTFSSTYFPIVSCIISDNVSTDNITIDGIEEYEAFYITVEIYAKNQTKGANLKVAAQVIIDELVTLTDNFFNKKKNMKKTLNKPVPNIDKDILRQVMNFQCIVGNIRGNIIRR